eukprot:6833045-Alexandrium_andersonii.AAC.1
MLAGLHARACVRACTCACACASACACEGVGLGPFERTSNPCCCHLHFGLAVAPEPQAAVGWA